MFKYEINNILYISIRRDVRRDYKELEKIEKYKPLNDEIAQMWSKRKVTVIKTVVMRSEDLIIKFEKFVGEIGTDMRMEHAEIRS